MHANIFQRCRKIHGGTYTLEESSQHSPSQVIVLDRSQFLLQHLALAFVQSAVGMAHRLTARELSRYREAFTDCDAVGEGTIHARSLCRALELVGETPSRMMRALFDGADDEEERISFEEFLTITVGPPWKATGPDPEKMLNEAAEDIDDGSGHVPLRGLLRIVHEHMEQGGYQITDVELVDVCRQALDRSECAGGSRAPEIVRRVFEEEFAHLRKGQNVDAAIAGAASFFPTSFARKGYDVFSRLRFAHLGIVKRFRNLRARLGWRAVVSVAHEGRVDDDGESKDETAHMINLTVVGLGGERLMVDAFAFTWPILALQQHIETVVGVAVHRQLLFLAKNDGFMHELCAADACLSKAGVLNDSTILLVVKDEEVEVDYKNFVSRFMDVCFERGIARASIQGRGL